jgi:hypothetical protein
LQEVVSQLNDYFEGREPVLIVNSILKAPISKKEFGLLDIPLKNKNLSRTSQDFR